MKKKLLSGVLGLLLIPGLLFIPQSFAIDDSLIASREQALVWWQEYAQAGNANAQYTLGKMYTTEGNGLDIEKNYKTAFSWFLKAAVQGHVKAQYEVAQAYSLGIGIAKDKNVAKTWYKQAADHGHVKAQNIRTGKVEDPVSATPTYAPPSNSQQAVRSQNAAAPQTETQDSSPMAASDGGFFGMFEDIALLDSITVGDGGGKYWSWWLGALGLGGLTIGFWLVVGVPLGVSSSWDRLARFREDRELAKAQASMNQNREATQDAMLAAAIEEFGEEHVKQHMDLDLDSPGLTAQPARKVEAERQPWHAHLTFLLMLLIGGFIATVTGEGFELQFSLGSEFERVLGYGTSTWILLMVGGTLVGFGTRMGGGCSSGHGLSGCSRLQPGSLVGTGSFFGTAILVSLILEALA